MSGALLRYILMQRLRALWSVGIAVLDITRHQTQVLHWMLFGCDELMRWLRFFDSDASMGAKDGWSFHEDGNSGMHVVLQNCTGLCNGIDPARSFNGCTTHDAIHAVVLGGSHGLSTNDSEVHAYNQRKHGWWERLQRHAILMGLRLPSRAQTKRRCVCIILMQMPRAVF